VEVTVRVLGVRREELTAAPVVAATLDEVVTLI
jgi:hypothetical protein